jgi:hypothetical protein
MAVERRLPDVPCHYGSLANTSSTVPTGHADRPAFSRRAPDYESGGQEFESLRARHQLFDFDSEFLRDFFSLDIGWSQGSTGATPQWEAGEVHEPPISWFVGCAGASTSLVMSGGSVSATLEQDEISFANSARLNHLSEKNLR